MAPRVPSLVAVLRAVAALEGGPGYCQGLNFIVAAVLLEADEDAAYWLTLVLLQQFNVRALFGAVDGMDGDGASEEAVDTRTLHDARPDRAILAPRPLLAIQLLSAGGSTPPTKAPPPSPGAGTSFQSVVGSFSRAASTEAGLRAQFARCARRWGECITARAAVGECIGVFFRGGGSAARGRRCVT